MCPPPNSPLPCQRHKDFIYATAHIHDVHGWDLIEHDRTPVVVDRGFEIAPGDASDVEVTNAHAWGVCTWYSATARRLPLPWASLRIAVRRVLHS